MSWEFNPFTGQLDKVQDLSGYVPYTGATTDIALGPYGITATYGTLGNISFSTDTITSTSGQIDFNDEDITTTGDIYLDYDVSPTRISKSAGITTIDGDYLDAFGELAGMTLSLGSYPLLRLGYAASAKDTIGIGLNQEIFINSGNFYGDQEIRFFGAESYISNDGSLHLKDYVGLYLGTGDDIYTYFDTYDWIINCTGAASVQIGNSVYEFHSPDSTRTQAFFETNYSGSATGIRISNTGTADTDSQAFVELANMTSVTTKTSGGMWSGWDNITDATRTSYLTFKTLNNGSLKDILKLGSESVGGDEYALVTGNLYVENPGGTDAKISMDGTGASTGVLRWESDNDTFVFDDDVTFGGTVSGITLSSLNVNNTAGTDATSTFDGTGANTGVFRWESDNDKFVFDDDVEFTGTVTGISVSGPFESVEISNTTGTDATITFDGTGANTGTLRYESDNDTFVSDDDLSVLGTLTYTSYTDTGSISSFLSALSTARPGDMIRLAPGTYDNDGDQIVIPSGVSIEKVGSGTVTILGTLFCNQDVNEKFTTTIKGITVDSTDASTRATYGMNEFKNGKFSIIGVTFTSNKPTDMGNLVTFSAYDRPVKAEMINCTVYGGTNDGISTKANDTKYGAQSYLILRNVNSYGNGSASNDQALTSHDTFRIEAHNCTFSAHTEAGVTHDAVLQDSVASPIALYNCKCYGSVGAQTVVGCYIELTTALTDSVALTISSGQNAFVSDCAINGKDTNGYQGIKITGATGDTHIIQNNHIYDFKQDGSNEAAIYCDANGTSTVHILNNKITGFLRGLELRYADTTAYVYVKGNYFSGATSYNVLSSASHTLVETEYNYFNENLFYLFTPSASDILKWEIDEDTEITGDFTVTGDVDLTGAVDITGDLGVTGDIDLAGDMSITGAGTNNAFEIYQGADNKGIVLYGYDDRITSYLQIYINQYGATQFSGTNSPLYFNDLSVLGDAKLRLGSSSQYWFEYASDDDMLELWTTNSDGSGTNKKLLYIDDGTDDMTFDCDVTVKGVAVFGDGTNQASFAVDGELTLAGTARVNKEFRVPLSDFNPGASGPTEVLKDIFPVYEFSIGDDMHTSFEMPPDWASGTDITVEVYWAIDEAYATNNGEVQWSASWRAVAVGEVITAGASGTLDFGDVNIPATANTVVKTTATVSGASLSAGDLVAFNGARVALDGGTDPTAEPYIIDVRVEYISDKLGEAT